MSIIKDVSKKSGFSVATVSRVLNNSDLVRPETKDKIKEVMKELNYSPNLLARNLRRLKTQMVLVLVPSISNPYYSEIVQGIQDVLSESGFHVLLCTTESILENERSYIDMLEQKLADGMIWIDAIHQELVEQISGRFPVVFCSEYFGVDNISYVSIDNEKAAYESLLFLYKQGYRRIALFNTNEKYTYSRSRKRGYQKALQDVGLEVDNQLIVNVDFDKDKTKKALDRMLHSKSPIDAILTTSDNLAFIIMKELEAHSVKIGRDIGLVSFDNLDYSELTNPSLTTINQPRYSIGKIASEMLIKQILEENKKANQVILEHELIIRNSTLIR